jgi:tRNA 2-selenouridine synthase
MDWKDSSLVDLRTPAEFAQGHIPGAINLPLLTNEERHVVGCAYKQQGVAVAIDMGLQAISGRLTQFVRQLRALEPLTVYCWRGGMRSGSVTALCQQLKIRVQALPGGYKAFRRWALAQINKPRPLLVLGGYTGCGKSQLLREWAQRGVQVLDLEKLANHRGSSFGGLGMPPQPTQEQFENEICMSLWRMKPDQPIWVEDESRLLGHCEIPNDLYRQLRAAPMMRLECTREERINNLVKEYGAFTTQEAREAMLRLSKRLGGQRTAQIGEAIERRDVVEAASLLLDYYDRTYAHKRGYRL